MKKQSKFHAFWKNNRHPITMKDCAKEKEVHKDNRSKEQLVALERLRAKNLAYDYEHQLLTKED